MKKKLKKRTSSPRAHKKAQKAASVSPKSLPIDAARALLVSLAFAIGTTLIAALIAYFCPDPVTMALPLGLAAAAITAVGGGFFATRLHGGSALVCGLINAALTSALMLLASLFCKPLAYGYASWLPPLLHTAFVALTIGGAYLGLPRKR